MVFKKRETKGYLDTSFSMDSNKNLKTFLRDNAMFYGIKDKNYSNPSISRQVEKEKFK